MAVVGYARVSSQGQDLSVQLAQLEQAGCTKVFAEKKSGTRIEGRPEFEACMTYLRDGDTLVITRLDRLSRSMADFFKTISLLQEKGVAFKVVLQPEIDTTTPNGRLLTGILACMAEFENAIRAERQRDGIAAAKANGVYTRAKNGHPSWKWAQCKLALDRGQTYRQVAKDKNVSEKHLRRKYPGFNSNSDMSWESVRKPENLIRAGIPTTPSAAEAVEAEATPKESGRKPGILGGIFGGR